MSLLPVLGNKLDLNAGTPASTDIYDHGLRKVGASVRASTGLTPVTYSQGLPVDVNGTLCLVDATLGLPAGTHYQNGFPILASGLCISTAGVQSWQNGVPVDVNGAVCA